jgi:hypothetical protein
VRTRTVFILRAQETVIQKKRCNYIIGSRPAIYLYHLNQFKQGSVYRLIDVCCRYVAGFLMVDNISGRCQQ